MRYLLMKLGILAAGASLLLTAQPAQAQQCCQPTNCCNPCGDMMCGDWEVFAHALVLVPATCEYDYAAVDIGNNVTDWGTAKCDLDWGVRVGGAYMEDCWFAGLWYQWFESTEADETVGDAATNNVRALGSGNAITTARLSARLKLRYQNVDVRVGKFLYKGCQSNFFLFGNARWVDLEYRRSLRGVAGTGVVQTFNEKAQLQGGALGVGLGGIFDLWCDVGIFGEANVLGVIADRSTKNTSYVVDGTVLSDINYKSETCISPELNFRIGLNYTYSCGCGTVIGEIGYEYDQLWNAVAFAGDGLSIIGSKRVCEDVGFSGLFFGARFLF